MLSINVSDVIGVILSIKTYRIALAIVLVVAIAVIVLVRKLPKRTKKLVRSEAWIALIAALVIIVNLICTGPMSTLLTSVAGQPATSITPESMDRANELIKEIAEEGIVLLENDEDILPLKGKKINVFGWSATNPCYGGTGSGALNKQYDSISFLEGLEMNDIAYNQELIDFYTSYHDASLPNVQMRTQNWTLPQPYAADYNSTLLNNAKKYSDTAIIFISRVGGEGADLPTDMQKVIDGTWNAERTSDRYCNGSYDDTVNKGKDWDEGDHYLQLSNPEEEMVAMVCANFDNVIVIYNSANAFELGWVEDYESIKGVIWCAGTGQTGFDALGEILAGTVNPSGRLVDTYVYDLTATPTWNNFGNFIYDNMSEFAAVSNPTFVNYTDGIYVGYKFYTTAADEGLIDYDETVQYSFGYGLSYTDFTQELSDLRFDGKNLNFTVKVTNTGAKAGKDVVEIYYNPPYTNGGIEKASSNLVEFAKTDVLAPGKSQTLSFSIALEQMASYDTYVNGCYVLEAGDYEISINRDAYDKIDSKTYTLSDDIVYNEGNKRDSDKVTATNKFADYAEGDLTFLSRADGFANYAEATAAPTNYSMAADAKAGFYNITNYLTAEATAKDEDPNAKMPTTGAKGDLKLVDLRGLAYDDAKWDELLDQLTIAEMNSVTSLGGYQTAAIASIEKYRTNDCDGPASINNNFTGQGSVGFPAAVMIAATWNDDLAYAFGDSIGTMACEMNVSGWYGPAMNTHRSAFAGRNFEYYSEDGVLGGSIAANAIKGAQAQGVYAYMKHFALNDQESNRVAQLNTWAAEQAIREIYLKPFEIAVKEGGSRAVMSAFNYIGNRWAGGSSRLLMDILRGEWGFEGFVETDYFGVYGYMNADQAIRNGSDLMLVNYAQPTNDMHFTSTAGAVTALRNSAHRILYVVANSFAYSEAGLELAQADTLWETILTRVNTVVLIILVVLEAIAIVKFLKRKEGNK